MSGNEAKTVDTLPSSATSLARPLAVLPVRGNHAKAFLRELARELIREISPATKIISLVGIAILVSGFLYLGHAMLTRYRQQHEVLSQAQTLNRRIDEQEKVLAQLSERTDKKISNFTLMSSDLKQSNLSILNSLSLPNRLWNSYSNGVCLIAGSYRLIDRSSGRPIRYPEVELSPEERLLIMGTKVPLTPEGRGEIVEMEYVGTGFHVGGGYVLTNRHIARRPWEADELAQFLISTTGAIPRLEKLVAFFPGYRQPIALKFRGASKSADVAVCTLKAPFVIPALPLARQSGATMIGKSVVVMGYPTGPDRMLALLAETEADALVNEYGDSLFTLLDQIAKRKLIKPLTTHGHIADLYKDRIVFDSSAGQGSSGTPVFGESSEVIGIKFAVLVGESASNFAVPIAAGIEQLEKAGWKPEGK